MTKDFIIMNGLIFFYIIQRLGELMLSKSNDEWLKQHHYAIERDPNESLRMKIFHSTWFAALIIESNYRQSFQPLLWSLVAYLVLGVCLMIRLHSMGQLKKFWSIKVFYLDSPVIATTGLYRYIRHPNYFVVICELFFIPFLFKAYWTMVLFSMINFYILSKRIQAEESVLMSHANYRKHFEGKKRFLPFIFILCLSILPLQAKEIAVHSSSYGEAKKKENYLKFQSTSTKLGFITTSFDGYAKDFKVLYEDKNQTISRVEVVISVNSMDTDVSSRDEKMHNDIMDAKKFPDLKATSTDPVKLVSGEQNINMTFVVKDKSITRPVVLNLDQKENKWRVTGKVKLGLQEMGLPDPSIAIAKVRDQFDIEFEIVLRE